MPPKATATTDGLDAASARFLLSVIKTCAEISPNWQLIAEENGIKHARNVAPKFNTILAKVGFKLEKGKIIPLDQENSAQNGRSPSAPSTPRAKKVTPRKLKVKEEENEAEDEEETTPAKVTPKKRKVGEEEDESEDGDGPTSAKATTTKAVPKKHKAKEEDAGYSDDEETIRAKATQAKTALKKRKVNAKDAESGTGTAPSTLKASHVEEPEEKSQDEEGELVVAEGEGVEDDAAETA